jgi:hypothetical protein
MSDEFDLSAGDADDKDIRLLLKKDAWLFRWERRLTRFTLCLIAAFYICLLAFIFIGHFRFTWGSDYWFVSSRPHLVSDIPIIVALSTVPTLLLIALLRYFHHRDGKKGDDDISPIPMSAQALAEILKAVAAGGK